MGIEHPDFLLERLTANQITDWMAYFEFLHEERSKKDKPKKQTVEEQRQAMIDLVKASGGKIKKRKK